MLRNPLLATMGIDDLNQRYRDSYIRYGGEIIFVQGLYNHSAEDEGNWPRGAKMVRYSKDEGETLVMPFNGDLVDVSRPAVGWYHVPIYNEDRDLTKAPEQDKHFVFFQLNNQRQWSRGLGHHTTQIVCYTADTSYINRYKLYEMAYANRPPFKHRMSVDQVVTEVEKNSGVILQPYLAVLADQRSGAKNKARIMWRNNTIGEIQGKTVTFSKTQFEDEVRESIFDLQCKTKPFGHLAYDDKERDKWYTINSPRQRNPSSARRTGRQFIVGDWARGNFEPPPLRAAGEVRFEATGGAGGTGGVEVRVPLNPPPNPLDDGPVGRWDRATVDDPYGIRNLNQRQLMELANRVDLQRHPIQNEVPKFMARQQERQRQQMQGREEDIDDDREIPF